MFRTVPLSIIGRFFFHCTHTAIVCHTACEQDRDGTVPSWSCSQAVSKPVWHIPFLCVQWKTPDDGQRNCSKHVEFYPKNEFEKLVRLVGFIIRIHVKDFSWLPGQCLKIGPVCSLRIHRPVRATPTFTIAYTILLYIMRSKTQWRDGLRWNPKRRYLVYQSLLLHFYLH